MKTRRIATLFALMLMLTMIFPFTSLLTTYAQQTAKTYAFVNAVPNPAGIGQDVLIHVGITRALQVDGMGWEDLTVKVTKPDNTTETLGPFTTDSTGGTGTVYIPTMTGNYTLQSFFPEQVTTANKRGGSPTIPIGTMLEASQSEPLTLIVQQEAHPIHPGFPLPTEYWTRPIDAQLREWHTIAGSSWEQSHLQ